MGEIILNYLKPELLVLIPVLYLIGLGFKNAKFVKDELIPIVLGVIGILLSFLYLFANCGWCVDLVYMSIIQGVLASGGSVYINQIYKQLKKMK